MLRAKVLVGQFAEGNPFLYQPPEIRGQRHKLYDSCVDKVTNPQIFVVFDRNQCYPEYLFMYTDRDTVPDQNCWYIYQDKYSMNLFHGTNLAHQHFVPDHPVQHLLAYVSSSYKLQKMVKICISHIIQIVHGIEGQMAVYGLNRSIYCHMDKITMNYLLYYTKPNKT
jgi:hypothetical protein